MSPPPATRQMPKTFPYRILVVDDEETVLTTTAAILRDAGYQVNTAHDGFEALANLRGSLPELLITDLHMPGMSGFELLGVVRKRFPGIVVIATSGKFTPVSLPEGVLAERFVPKGEVPPLELLEIVRQLMEEGPVRSRPAQAATAPAWLPSSSRGYVVITCPDCLRSFSVPSNGVEVGNSARVTCVHCGAEVSYYLDASVLAEPSLLQRTRKSLEASKRSINSAVQAIDESRDAINAFRRKRN